MLSFFIQSTSEAHEASFCVVHYEVWCNTVASESSASDSGGEKKRIQVR